MRRPEPRSHGQLESEILACLEATGRAMTAGEVQVELDSALAYTTVQTTLSRLHAKSALERRSRGRAHLYSLTGDSQRARSAMTAHEMLKLLPDGTDRAPVLIRFIAGLGPADVRLLCKLLAT